MPGTRRAIADAKVIGRVANVEQHEAALSGRCHEPRFVTQSLMEAGGDIHSCLKRNDRIIDQAGAERPSAIGDAKHQRSCTRRRALRHIQAWQAQTERAVVMAKFADAIVAPEGCKAARGLDVHRVGAVAEVEEKRARNHRMTLSPLAPLHA